MRQYTDLRVQDLIAKIAGVHLSSTIRVLKAVELIAASMDCDETDMFEKYSDMFDKDQPSDKNVQAVFGATKDIRQYLVDCGLGVKYLKEIKATRPYVTKVDRRSNKRWNKKSHRGKR